MHATISIVKLPTNDGNGGRRGRDGEKARAMRSACVSARVARRERSARSGSLPTANLNTALSRGNRNESGSGEASRNSRSRVPVGPERAHLKDTHEQQRVIIIKAFTLYQRAGVIHRRPARTASSPALIGSVSLRHALLLDLRAPRDRALLGIGAGWLVYHDGGWLFLGRVPRSLRSQRGGARLRRLDDR